MADNINTPYLGQGPTTTDVINTGYVGTGSDTSEVEENPKIFTSEVTFETTVSLGGALHSASAASFGAVTGTTGSFSGLVSAQTLSFDTLAPSAITVGSSTAEGWFVTIGASGMSLGLKSGGSLYFINSTVSAA